MGQDITVSARAGASPSVRMFDLNRSLTGMAVESYDSAEAAAGSRPPDVLARRLFELGATRVTVYSSAVTVEAPAARWAELEPRVVEAIGHLFRHYGEGAAWPPEEAPVAPAEPEAEVAAAG